jgi:flagellar hook-associated protein 3 FlgL
MTTPRITQGMIAQQSLTNLQTSLDRLQKLQAQVSSGKQILRPSDSPVGTVAAMRYRAELARNDQYTRNVDDGAGWLALADTTLTSADDQLRRVRDLVLSGQSGAASGADRAAMADEVDSIRESMLQLAGTTYLGHPIFGGTTSGTDAYDAAGVYQGESMPVTRTIAPGETVTVSVLGPAVFGPDADGVFATLARVSADLRSDPAALGPDLGRLDTLVSGLHSQQATVGVTAQRLELTKTRLATQAVDLKQSLSAVEDIDLPSAVLDLNIQQVTYQTALAVTSHVIQPTLVDFLR